jgi:hypothetical protein
VCCGNGAACRGRELVNPDDRDAYFSGLVYGIPGGQAPNVAHSTGVETRPPAAPQTRTHHDQLWMVETLGGEHETIAPARIIRYNPDDRQDPWPVTSSPTTIPYRSPSDDGLGRGCSG